MARGWLLTGQKAKGKEYVEAIWKNASQYLNYYLSLSNDRFLHEPERLYPSDHDYAEHLRCGWYGKPSVAEELEKQLNALYPLLSRQRRQHPQRAISRISRKTWRFC